MRILVNEFCGHAFQIELSRELARRGHQVLHVYFADNHSTPKGTIQAIKGDSPGFAIEGLHIPMEFSKHSIVTRRKADVAYGRATAAKVESFRPDVVMSANMPLDGQNILQKAAHRHNAKFVFWLQDIYSHAIGFVMKAKLGFLGAPCAAYYRLLEQRILRKSDAVVCIAPAFAEVAASWGVEQQRIHTIENWAPLGEVLETEKDNPWSREQGLGDKFCFMYSGTLGMKHRPELLLALARHLETRNDACLVVIAGGAGAEWLRANSAGVGGDVLKLLPFQPYDRLSEVLGSADVLLALLDAGAGTVAVPSKVLSYLCAGRSLLVAAPKENHAAAIVELAKAGVVVSPDDEGQFVAAAVRLMECAKQRRSYAASARVYAERSFAIAAIADDFLGAFDKCRELAESPYEAAVKGIRKRNKGTALVETRVTRE
jgi:glycosyltransferase involved in cell wall biosynthesis